MGLLVIVIITNIVLSWSCSAGQESYPVLKTHLQTVSRHLHDAAKSLVAYPTNPETEEGQFLFDLYARTKATADDMGQYIPLLTGGRVLPSQAAGIMRGMRDVYMKLVEKSTICDEAEASLEKAVTAIKTAISVAEQEALTEPKFEDLIFSDTG